MDKYADDCTQRECIMKGECSDMQKVFHSVQNWSDTNKMKLNAMKTKDMWICFSRFCKIVLLLLCCVLFVVL